MKSQHRNVGTHLALIAIAALGLWTIWPQSSDATGPWLARLNQYRAMVKLGAVQEDEQLSQGDTAHAHYVVANFSATLRAKKPLGVDLHLEDRSRPGFTYAGFIAGRSSDVLITMGAPLQTWAIDAWMTGPFHRMPLLDPALQRVGYGDFCADQICAAAVNVSGGSMSPELMLRRRISSGMPITGQSEALGGGWGTRSAVPVEFPANDSVMDFGMFNQGEWPDPLTSCPGYSYPVGIPITLQIGRFLSPRISSWSLKSKGAQLDACGFDSDKYRNPDELTQKLGRNGLEAFGTVVLIPRTPLKAGSRYDVTMNVDDVAYSWSFSISSAAQTLAD